MLSQAQNERLTQVGSGTDRLRDDSVPGQDQTAWAIQGKIMDRTTEHLDETDVGLIMFRRLLDQQMKIVENGGELMNIQRDSAKNQIHAFP
jgi:5,5'-dehydrodivanillate O-demethylase